jgi:hypothetical protein
VQQVKKFVAYACYKYNLAGEIIRTYVMVTYFNKAIKVASSTPMDFGPNIMPAFTNFNIMESSDDLLEMIKTLASNTVIFQQNVMSFQQKTRSSVHNLEKQMGQVASSVGKL